MKPLLIELYCGLGGWTEGALAAGYDAVGFDIERHAYGEHRYPAQLVLQDVLTLDGSQFRNAALILASPPCQEYSYMAMPWTRAKQIAGALLDHGLLFPGDYTGSRTVPELNALFDACFRIQREASEAAGRHIPMVVENVLGAQPWVGPAKANFGSYYLWCDIGMANGNIVIPGAKYGEFLRPPGRTGGTEHPQGSWFAIADSKQHGAGQKTEGRNFHVFERTNGEVSSPSFHGASHETRRVGLGVKVPDIKLSEVGFNVAAAQRYREGIKQAGHSGRAWFADSDVAGHFSSKSDSRKAASAQIAKIPFTLAEWIARSYLPEASGAVPPRATEQSRTNVFP